MPECSFIDYRLQNRGVAVLTLDNPPLNLTTLVTLDKLLSACRDIACDERVRAVVVTGSGSKAFWFRHQRIRPCARRCRFPQTGPREHGLHGT